MVSYIDLYFYEYTFLYIKNLYILMMKHAYDKRSGKIGSMAKLSIGPCKYPYFESWITLRELCVEGKEFMRVYISWKTQRLFIRLKEWELKSIFSN